MRTHRGRVRTALILLLLLASLEGGVLSGQASDLSETYRKGNDLIQSGKWEDAAEVFKKGIERYPRDAWLYVYLGWTYRNLKRDLPLALSLTLQGDALKPLDPQILLNLKGAYIDLGNSCAENREWEKAEGIYLQALARFPDEGWLHSNLGWVYRNLGEYSKGLEAALKGYELNPDEKMIRENLRWAYIALGDHYRLQEKSPSRSISLYLEALKTLPDDPLIYDRLGWAFIFDQKRDEAFRAGYFEKAAKLYFDRNDVQQKVTLSLPFAGKWLVLQGNNGKVSHFGLGMYAWDFMRVDGNLTHPDVRGRALADADFFAFRSEVLAPAPGMVAEVVNDVEDNPYGQWNYSSLGNLVRIDHGDGTSSMIFHFLKGSIVVKVGQRVERGQLLGRVGNSGYSDVPHLHYALVDPNGVTIPAAFSRDARVATGVPQEGDVVWNSD